MKTISPFHSLLILGVSLFFFGCPPKGTVGTTDGNGTGDIAVGGKVIHVRTYCGGAAPSEEMLAAITKPVPKSGQELIFRSGDENDLKGPVLGTAVTGGDGTFKVSLKKGKYCVCFGEKRNPRDPSFFQDTNLQVDKPCDSDWLKKCDKVIEVGPSGLSNVDFKLNERCFLNTLSPCVSWQGPLPPAAPPRIKD